MSFCVITKWHHIKCNKVLWQHRNQQLENLHVHLVIALAAACTIEIYLIQSFPAYTRARIMRPSARALCLSQQANLACARGRIVSIRRVRVALGSAFPLGAVCQVIVMIM